MNTNDATLPVKNCFLKQNEKKKLPKEGSIQIKNGMN